jgi:hypothetical protein
MPKHQSEQIPKLEERVTSSFSELNTSLGETNSQGIGVERQVTGLNKISRSMKNRVS